jgi:hypothetical protein
MLINFAEEINVFNSNGAGEFNIFPNITGGFNYYNNVELEVYENDIKMDDILYPFTENNTYLSNASTSLTQV